MSGECFADPAVIDRLRKAGHDVDSHNTSWLPHMYEERGDQFFGDLNGLFSGLVIDRRERCAVLFNDRYGLERLYYHEGKHGFYFASEAKALLRVLPDLRAYDMAGLAQYLRYGCTLEWRSLFRDIALLPGGSLWRFHGHRCDKRRYFSPTNWESQPPLTTPAFEQNLHETFATILPRYFDSSSHIGISLTGGLDTRMILACSPSVPTGLVSYTFAAPRGETLDVRLAAQVAQACDLPHHILRIGDDFFSEFASLADRTVYVTDGDLGIWGTHEIYLNHQARELAPVRLTGNFGSEILRGATTFKPLATSPGLLHPDVRQALSDDGARLSKDGLHPVSFAAFREIPWHLFGLFKAAQSQITFRTPYLDNQLVALAFRTPDQTKRSSGPALHVIRESRSELARIRTDSGVLPSSRLLSLLGMLWYRPTFKIDYWRNVGLPRLLRPLDASLTLLSERTPLLPEHRFLHYRRWFRKELRAYVQERLNDPHITRSQLWNQRFVEQLAKDHISGRRNYVRELDTVLTCGVIDRLLLSADV
jgi:asparagine synthase (glutamine-hydrolysing)